MNSQHFDSFENEKQYPDEILWETFKQGDEGAFERIYNLNVDALYNYGMNFVKDQFVVRESIQDLFVGLWSRRENLGKTDNIRFYLLRSLRRKISQFTKDEKRKVSDEENEKFSLSNLLVRKSFDQFLGSANSEMEIAQKLIHAMEQLPARQKEALYHIYYEDLSYEEVASMMNVSIKTVYNLAWRGIVQLRKSLSKNAIFSISPILIISALKISFDLLEIYQ